MFADQIYGFISDLEDLTKERKIHWERFPLNFPISSNIFIQDFMQKHPHINTAESYFFSHRNGFILFIRYSSGKTKEAVYAQKRFGDPVIELTEGYAMDDAVASLGTEIDQYVEYDEALPGGLYHFLAEIRSEKFLK